uniref:Uncharacterized protein n=1 Tax=Arundo donax TaxID=35708 RepID=A0A0A9DYT5_ARUDO
MKYGYKLQKCNFWKDLQLHDAMLGLREPCSSICTSICHGKNLLNEINPSCLVPKHYTLQERPSEVIFMSIDLYMVSLFHRVASRTNCL